MIINEILQWIVLIWVVWSINKILYVIKIILDGMKVVAKWEEERRKKEIDERN